MIRGRRAASGYDGSAAARTSAAAGDRERLGAGPEREPRGGLYVAGLIGGETTAGSELMGA